MQHINPGHIDKKRAIHKSGIVLFGVFCLIICGTTVFAQQQAGVNPVYAAYFYDKGCQPCSGAEYNVEYLHQLFPQLSVQQFNASQDEALGKWLARRVGRSDFRTPALFIGDQAWIGEVELIPAAVQPVVEHDSIVGTEKIWNMAALIRSRMALSSRFPSLEGAIAITFGLVDGLLPSAISALLFVEMSIVYGHLGKSVISGLASCAAFSLSIFVVLLVLGLAGFDHPIWLEAWLGAIRQPAQILTLLCVLILALIPGIRWARRRHTPSSGPALGTAHRPQVGWITLGAYLAGIPLTILSLASTGLTYAPALIYIYSIFTAPSLAVIAMPLYSALFVLPLVVILVLAFKWVGTGFLAEHP